SARRALSALRAALWKYNLQLNDDKTSITPSKMIFKEKWRIDLETFSLSNIDTIQQERDMSRLLDNALYHCTATKDARPAIWACRRLSELKNVRHNLALILDTLFRL